MRAANRRYWWVALLAALCLALASLAGAQPGGRDGSGRPGGQQPPAGEQNPGGNQRPPAEQQAPPEGEPPLILQLLKAADENEDMLLTPEEFLSALSELFLVLDRNEDGVLDPTEIAPLRPPRQGNGQPLNPSERADRFCERNDADGDGQLSPEEFPGTPEQFATLDKNGDGYLSHGELTSAAAHHGNGHGGPGREGDRFAELDADGDGLLSPEEFPGDDEKFAELDTDGDGYLTLEEVRAGAPHEIPRPPRGPRDIEEFIAENDADEDGQLSLEEFPGLDEHFVELDADADGYVTYEEIVAWREARFHARVAEAVARWDVDQDGQVSIDEFPGEDERFAQLDLNDDGYLTLDEMIFAIEAEREAAAEEDKPGEGPAPAPNPAHTQIVERMIERCDGDGDGQLNRGEFRGSDRLFENIDANGDGQLCTEEFLNYGGSRGRKGQR